MWCESIVSPNFWLLRVVELRRGNSVTFRPCVKEEVGLDSMDAQFFGSIGTLISHHTYI